MKYPIKDYTVITSGTERTGVIAQEIQEVFPHLVKTSSEGYLMVENPNVWLLVKAIQEITQRLDIENQHLKAQIALNDEVVEVLNERVIRSDESMEEFKKELAHLKSLIKNK